MVVASRLIPPPVSMSKFKEGGAGGTGGGGSMSLHAGLSIVCRSHKRSCKKVLDISMQEDRIVGYVFSCSLPTAADSLQDYHANWPGVSNTQRSAFLY